jgi:hypothetical protein
LCAAIPGPIEFLMHKESLFHYPETNGFVFIKNKLTTLIKTKT